MLSPKEILKFAYLYDQEIDHNLIFLPDYKKILYLKKIKLSENLFVIKKTNDSYCLSCSANENVSNLEFSSWENAINYAKENNMISIFFFLKNKKAIKTFKFSKRGEIVFLISVLIDDDEQFCLKSVYGNYLSNKNKFNYTISWYNYYKQSFLLSANSNLKLMSLEKWEQYLK